MNIVSRLLTRSNLEWASLFVGFAIIWMVSGFFVQEPSPPALIEKKDPIVRVIDQKAENFSKEIVVKGFTKADKKVLVKSETSGKIVDLPIAQGTFVKKGEVICSLFVAERQANFDKALLVLILLKSFLKKNYIPQSNCKMQSQTTRGLSSNWIMQT